MRGRDLELCFVLSNLVLHALHRGEARFSRKSGRTSIETVTRIQLFLLFQFDKMLMHSWTEAKRSGALQYDLNLLYKTLPGRFGLSAQLNMERATHRRKPHSFRNLNEPFDSRRFNFTKIRPEEVTFFIIEEVRGKLLID